MNNWNDDWREALESKNERLMVRLAECRSISQDIPIIAQEMYRYNRPKTKEQCLDRTIEWITDWNNQYNLVPEPEEYDSFLSKINI